MKKHCDNCIHNDVCNDWAHTSGIPFVNYETCEYYKRSFSINKMVKNKIDKDLIIPIIFLIIMIIWHLILYLIILPRS